MKLVNLACPKCNAQLQINGELNQATCSFCGHHFIIDDERQKVDINMVNPKVLGEAIEYGRRSVRGGNAQLIQEVGSMIEPLCNLNEQSVRVERLSKVVGYEKKRAEFIEKPFVKYLPVVAPIGAFISFFLFGLIADASVPGSLATGFFMAVVATFLAVAIPYYMIYEYRRDSARLEAATTALNQSQEDLKGKNINIIPPAYRTRERMTYIYDSLVNQRAMNMQEAINLYEDQMYKNKMQAIEAQKVQELKKMNRNMQTKSRRRR